MIKAAEAGSADAQYLLGTWYADGTVMDHDLKAAKEWFSRAAAQGNEAAINALNEL